MRRKRQSWRRQTRKNGQQSSLPIGRYWLVSMFWWQWFSKHHIKWRKVVWQTFNVSPYWLLSTYRQHNHKMVFFFPFSPFLEFQNGFPFFWNEWVLDGPKKQFQHWQQQKKHSACLCKFCWESLVSWKLQT